MKEYTIYLLTGGTVNIFADEIMPFADRAYFYKDHVQIAMFVLSNISGWVERKP